MKKFLLLLTFIMLLLQSCRVVYTSDASPRELMDIGISAIDKSDFVYMDDDAIYSFADDRADVIDFCIVRSRASKNINEIGIFRLAEGTAEQFAPAVRRYAENLKAAYGSMNYFPAEKVKYENSRVVIIGDYVIYSFLNDHDSDAFYRAVYNSFK